MLDLNTSLAISINGRSLLLKKGVGGPDLELGKQAKTRKRHNKNFSATIIEASELAFKTTRCGLRLRLFWLKRISENHFTPAYVFGKHGKLGQTEINFCIDFKITLLTHKTISSFILPSNDLHFSHALSKLLTCTPHRHHWYSPSSIVTELHPLPHAKRRSTLSLTPVRAPPTVRRAPLIHPQ